MLQSESYETWHVVMMKVHINMVGQVCVCVRGHSFITAATDGLFCCCIHYSKGPDRRSFTYNNDAGLHKRRHNKRYFFLVKMTYVPERKVRLRLVHRGVLYPTTIVVVVVI